MQQRAALADKALAWLCKTYGYSPFAELQAEIQRDLMLEVGEAILVWQKAVMEGTARDAKGEFSACIASIAELDVLIVRLVDENPEWKLKLHKPQRT
jgi:hypothetical protein